MGMDYMERFHLIQHPLLEHKLFQLRNKYTGTKDFRKCVQGFQKVRGGNDLPALL